MPATVDRTGNATLATSVAVLDFDRIKARVAEMREIDVEDVTDGYLAKFFGLTRETIWHYRHGEMKPRFETVSAMADRLGLTLDEIRAGNPSPQSSQSAKPKADRS